MASAMEAIEALPLDWKAQQVSRRFGPSVSVGGSRQDSQFVGLNKNAKSPFMSSICIPSIGKL
jgi:hypothetical protein